MHPIYTLLLWFLLPISSRAFTLRIPANVTEGFYAVTIDSTTGREIHTRLDTLLSLPPPPPPPPVPETTTHNHQPQKKKRSSSSSSSSSTNSAAVISQAKTKTKTAKTAAKNWSPKPVTYCGDSYIQATDLTEHAQATFTDNCDRTNASFIRQLVAVYAAYGTTVAYMCNFSNKGNPCRSKEFLEALRLIGDNCLWSRGGVLQTGEVILKGWKKGYGYTSNIDTISVCDSKGGRWGAGYKSKWTGKIEH